MGNSVYVPLSVITHSEALYYQNDLTCKRGLVLKEDLKSDVRSGNPPKFNCGLQFGWSCNVPQDPDAQLLYHGTINLPTNLAIQIPAIPSLPPVSPDLDQLNVTLTLSGEPVTDSLLSSCRTMPVPGPTLRSKKRTVSYRTGMQEKRPLGSFEVCGNGRDTTWYGQGCEKFHVFRFM